MKYYPVIVTSSVSIALLVVVIAFYFVKLLVTGESIAVSGLAVFEIFKVGLIVIYLPISLSWLFGKIRSRGKNKIASSLVFALVASISFIVFIALLSLNKHGDFLDDALSKKGLENILILFSMFFGLSVAIYLSLAKERY
jgi:hypothetical protein